MDYNYHTHTERCGHANGEDEQYVLAAIEAGFKVIGFSDHIPFKNVIHPSERMNYDQLDDYINSIESLKIKYKDKIEVKLGFELEYFPEYNDYYKEILNRCDYLICGQHNKILDHFSYDQFSNDEDVIVYANQVKAAIESGLIKFVAHPDYFMLGRRTWSKACEEAVHIIAKAAKENNVALEINLNGVRYGKLNYQGNLVYPYPFRPFWEIVSEYDPECIYSYDAHKPFTLLEKERIDLVEQTLKGIKLSINHNYRI